MAAIIHDISDQSLPFPEFIIIDTSIVLRLVPAFRTHPHYDAAIDFLKRLQAATSQGNVIPVLPYLVLEEFCFKILKYCLRDAGQQAGVTNWHVYYKSHPDSISTFHPTIKAFYERLLAFPMYILDPNDMSFMNGEDIPSIAERMINIIGEFNILPKDATILSEAERMEMFTIATLDKDYARAEGFTILMPQ